MSWDHVDIRCACGTVFKTTAAELELMPPGARMERRCERCRRPKLILPPGATSETIAIGGHEIEFVSDPHYPKGAPPMMLSRETIAMFGGHKVEFVSDPSSPETIEAFMSTPTPLQGRDGTQAATSTPPAGLSAVNDRVRGADGTAE